MSIVVSQSSTGATPMVACPLCCEEKPASSMCLLSRCSHENCRDCLVRWIEKAEASGHKTQAECPFCRIEITEEEMLSILGRPFQPAQLTSLSQTNLVVDDLTRQWLEEHCKPCLRCGAHIEKIPGSCDMMECLCGYRFCFGCSSPGAECSCTPSHHRFWDNILDQLANQAAPGTADTNESTGHIELRNHIQERKRKDTQERVRKGRLDRRARLRREEQELDEATSSASWLFCGTNKTSICMLHIQLNRRSVLARRRQTRLSRLCFLSDAALRAPWLFEAFSTAYGLRILRQVTKRVILRNACKAHRNNRHKLWCRPYQDADGAIVYGHWRFQSEANNHALKLLECLMKADAKADEMKARKCFADCEDWDPVCCWQCGGYKSGMEDEISAYYHGTEEEDDC